MMNSTPARPSEGLNEQPMSFRWRILTSLGRMAFMYLMMKMFLSPKQPSVPGSDTYVSNSWIPGDLYDLHIYIHKQFPVSPLELLKSAEPMSKFQNQSYRKGHKAINGTLDLSIPIEPHHLFQDSALYLTAVLIPATVDLSNYSLVDSDTLISNTQSLFTLMEPFTDAELVSLWDSKPEDATDSNKVEMSEKILIHHWLSKMHITVVFDTSRYRISDLAKSPLSLLTVNSEKNTYNPYVSISTFWLLEKDYLCMNETTKQKYEELPLSLTFSTDSTWYWGSLTQFELQSSSHSLTGFSSRKDLFNIKRILLETNRFQLIFSAIFMLLHTFFSFFAMKNDYQFWKQTDNMKGLSAYSTMTDLISEIIICLYLHDTGEASWVIIISMIMGVGLSAWKVTRALQVKITTKFPYIAIKSKESYVKSNTQEYDEIAIKWMTIVLAPVVCGYAIYTLKYNKFKSWYSYIISVLAGSVYAFGFIMMTPQLYINYRLKSVDHLPWRALIYRSLNTFVDDVAYFLIDMPWMHRLSCFRDDVIFFLYLYQRWIYKVDHKRSHDAPQSTDSKVEEKDTDKELEPSTATTELSSSTVEGAELRRRTAT